MALRSSRPRLHLRRRWQELRLIGQDPTLALGLAFVGLFVLLFVVYPLGRVGWQAFFDPQDGAFNLSYFRDYLSPMWRRHNLQVLRNTLVMGVGAATGGTVLGFVFAYTLVRCNIPFSRAVHTLALLPTISPPFAIAIASILLFGRNGLVTRQWLGIRFERGVNDIYGLDGLIFVQIITFFPVAYLIIRAMLERIHPSMEEAALNLGASKFHIFRTVTLPLLAPGIAGSFLLLFVESLADLGNPLLLGGNASVLSTEIFLAINGQYDQQKGAMLSLVLLIPTLTVFLLQHYYISRRSYISVTGKPAGGQAVVKEPGIRLTFITLMVISLVLILALYLSILVGSFTRLWGIDYSLDFSHYGAALTRGLNAILATTFLSTVATPVAGVIGMVVAYMVVRRRFTGKEALDFVSNLGGAVPGTILGIGYILAFINAPMIMVTILYGVLALYLVSTATGDARLRTVMLLGGAAVGYLLNWLPYLLGLTEDGWRYLLAAVFALLALAAGRAALPGRGRLVMYVLFAFSVALIAYNLTPLVTQPLVAWGRTLPGIFWPRLVVRLATFIPVFTQPTMAILGFTFLMAGGYLLWQVQPRARPWLTLGLLLPCTALVFFGQPLALVGTPYIVIAAYAVRSLPASVRAGVAALQQIDPSIEEASTNLGADAQTTFRRVTLPLILPAFIAGLIFAFARHMTSLSAIVFLTTAEWPILTVWILSEVEQGGMSTAAAYSVILIAIVLAAIGLVYWWLGRAFQGRGDVDLSLGAG